MMELLLVRMSDIITSQEPSRVDASIVATVRRLLRDLGGWDTSKIPPITGFVTQEGFVLHDGHHRVLAAEAEGLKVVPALNFAGMRRGDKISHQAGVRRYRKLIGHPLAAPDR